MAALAAFFPSVLPYAPGASEPAVERALIDAADEFCRRTRAIQEDLDPIAIQAGVALYELEPDAIGAAPATVVEAQLKIDAKVTFLEPETPGRRARVTPDWRAEQGAPTRYSQPSPALLRLTPVPDRAGLLYVVLATKPALDAQVLDDRLFEEWRTGIAAGALERLYLLPGQPYSAQGSAATWRGVFEAEVLRAQSAAERGGTKVTLRSDSCP